MVDIETIKEQIRKDSFDLLAAIKQLIEIEPNDQELGSKIRKLVKFDFIEN